MVNYQRIVELIEKFFDENSGMTWGDYKKILVEAGER